MIILLIISLIVISIITLLIINAVSKKRVNEFNKEYWGIVKNLNELRKYRDDVDDEVTQEELRYYEDRFLKLFN